MARRVVVNYAQVSRMFGDRSRESVTGSDSGLSSGDQAVLGRALAALEDEAGEKDVICAPNDQAAALLQTYLAEHAVSDDKLLEVHAGAVEAHFDGHDLGWLHTAIPWIRSKLGFPQRARRPDLSEEPALIRDRCRIAVLGDWGTGLYGAPPIANHITRDANYDVLLHLGDVYYSGSEREIQENFLDLWTPMAAASPGCLSRACNSNHEMYSGGGPYFNLTLPALKQPSPFFVLENDHWVLVGLDTAYVDSDLDDEQTSMLNQIVQRLTGRRLILFSHHPPFSLLSGQGPKLVRRLASAFEDRRIFAWYWGHEHLLALYDQHRQWGLHGRCVGHSGFPYFRPELGAAPAQALADEQVLRTLPATPTVPGGRVLDGPNEYLGDRRDTYGPNGFLRIELDGPRLHESLVSPSGVVLWEGDLV